MKKLPDRKGWGWKLMTFTAWRDQADTRAHTADALRHAIEAVYSGWKNCWKFLSKFPSNAAYTALELSDGGHVHLHVLAFTPFLVRENLAKLFVAGHNAQNGGSFRFAVVKDNHCIDLRTASTGSAREVAKYVCKGISPLDEAWLAGEESRLAMHPALLARWELAAGGKAMRRPYGALRGLMKAEREVDEEEKAEALGEGEPVIAICPECGAEGHDHFREVTFANAENAVGALHQLGAWALRGSKWRPARYELDDRPPLIRATHLPSTAKASKWAVSRREVATI